MKNIKRFESYNNAILDVESARDILYGLTDNSNKYYVECNSTNTFSIKILISPTNDNTIFFDEEITSILKHINSYFNEDYMILYSYSDISGDNKFYVYNDNRNIRGKNSNKFNKHWPEVHLLKINMYLRKV